MGDSPHIGDSVAVLLTMVMRGGECKCSKKGRTAIREAYTAGIIEPEKEARPLKSISVQPGGSIVPDHTVDASLYGLAEIHHQVETTYLGIASVVRDDPDGLHLIPGREGAAAKPAAPCQAITTS